MFKKFFIAVILGLLVMTSQIVSAADVNWDSVPRINSKAQLANYIEEGRRKGQTEFNFVLTNFKLSTDREIANKECARLADEYCYSFATAPSVNLGGVMGTGQLTYRILKEYPGTRIANAYLSRNKEQAWMNLTNEEQKLYNIAVGIVDEVNKHSSEEEKSNYIYKAIRDSVKEFSVKNERYKTAIGALIDGKANCQGYSDAFYMLGRMCGLDVRIIGGKSIDKYGKWGNHQWNTITFNNGKTYFVDVTNGNLLKTTYENIKKTHQCEWDIIPNLQ